MVTPTNPSLTAHWDTVYSTKTATDRSWTEESPQESLRFIERAAVDVNTPIIDIGGGASLLIDSLLERGYTDVTVLDIAEPALAEARARLESTGAGANASFIAADITQWTPTRTYALWHDRAVFHFLTKESDRAAYVDLAATHVAHGGHVVLVTFAPNGPETCSGLAVQRWSAEQLADLFADSFTLVESASLTHITPWGSEQPFTWVLLQRK